MFYYGICALGEDACHTTHKGPGSSAKTGAESITELKEFAAFVCPGKVKAKRRCCAFDKLANSVPLR
jgi:hypothetical protein